jgi:cytochrome c5
MSDAEIIGEIKRNYTEAQMEEGKVIWQTNCNRCHKLYTPGSYTIAEWENILPRMYPRTKLDKEQSGKVRAYILPNAKRS